MRTGAAVVKYARTFTRYPVGYCLRWVRGLYPVSSKYGSAIQAWNGAKYRHGPSTTPPIGVPVFFAGGKYGHIAVSVGKWNCRSTDWPRARVVSEVAISRLAKAWGYRYLGWTEDLNGVRIYLPPAQRPLFPAYPRDGREAFEVNDRGDAIKVIQVALSRPVTGTMTQGDIDAVKRYQRRHPALWPANGRVSPKTYQSFRYIQSVKNRWKV